VLLDAVAGGGERALLGGRGPEQADERVEPVGGRQDPAREVFPDDAVRPAGRGRQLAVGQLGGLLAARVPAPQLAQRLREIGQRPDLRRAQAAGGRLSGWFSSASTVVDA
jgi:hypothetical protein